MKKRIFTTLLAAITFCLALAQTEVKPTKAAQDFLDLKFGMFIHFGINTYTDQEWTDGTVPEKLFNPTKLDTDQWCRAAASAGMKYIVFTTKHHDGFCNWNTKYTDYSIKSATYKKDVLKQLAASCRKYGLKLGLYYSLWDQNYKNYADDYLYTQYMKNQLTELLTGYGDITLVWFDGAWDKCTGFGFGSPKAQGEEIMRHWRDYGTYRWQWDQIYAHIKHLSPNCLVMNNSGVDFTGIPLMPVDIRTGERATKESANKALWEFCGEHRYLPMQIEDIVSKKYWFYHEGDKSVKGTEQLLYLISDAKQMGANLLLNVGPMTDGQLRNEDLEVLKTLKK